MRIVIMGLQPLADGLPALEHGRTGKRLEAWLGGKPSTWFELRNVTKAGIDIHGKTAQQHGRWERELMDCYDPLTIVLGHDAARLLELEHGPGVPMYRWLNVAPPRVSIRWCLLPHPSPRSRVWNDPSEVTRMSRFLGDLRDQVVAARGLQALRA